MFGPFSFSVLVLWQKRSKKVCDARCVFIKGSRKSIKNACYNLGDHGCPRSVPTYSAAETHASH